MLGFPRCSLMLIMGKNLVIQFFKFFQFMPVYSIHWLGDPWLEA